MNEPNRNQIVDAILTMVEEQVDAIGPAAIGLDDETYSNEDIINVLWEIRQEEIK